MFRFGPEPEGNRTVADVLGKLNQHWPNLRWHVTDKSQPHEATLLYVDSAKARRHLHWQRASRVEATQARPADWYRGWLETRHILSSQQLAD